MLPRVDAMFFKTCETIRGQIVVLGLATPLSIEETQGHKGKSDKIFCCFCLFVLMCHYFSRALPGGLTKVKLII